MLLRDHSRAPADVPLNPPKTFVAHEPDQIQKARYPGPVQRLESPYPAERRLEALSLLQVVPLCSSPLVRGIDS